MNNERWLIYVADNGRILANLPIEQSYKDLYDLELNHLEIKNPPSDWVRYKVVNNELVKLSDVELFEISVYNRFLTDEERVLESIKPSHDEIKKAELTIEILEVLEGVL